MSGHTWHVQKVLTEERQKRGQFQRCENPAKDGEVHGYREQSEDVATTGPGGTWRGRGVSGVQENRSHGRGVARSCGLGQREAALSQSRKWPGPPDPAPTYVLHTTPPRNAGSWKSRECSVFAAGTEQAVCRGQTVSSKGVFAGAVQL